MGSSPLDPATPRPDRDLRRGHGTRALGPSDSSDNGSDLVGAPGLAGQVDGFGVERGNVSDTEEGLADNTAGPDVGDANLDSDSDRFGTGERASAARDTTTESGADIDTDHVESIPGKLEDPDEEDDDGR